MRPSDSHDDLFQALARASQLEAVLEDEASWQAFLRFDDEGVRELVKRFISDSNKHSILVSSLVSKVKQTALRPASKPTSVSMDLDGRTLSEVALNVEKYERQALDIYREIQGILQEADSKSLIKEGEFDSFAEILDRLIIEETQHIAAVSKYVGRIERIG